MKIFLTGGTGFIGSYVVQELSNNGHIIDVLARNPDKVPALSDLPGVRIIAGNLRSWDVIDKSLQGKDACIHIALNWGDNAEEMLINDTLVSVKLFEMAAKAGIKNLIYTSSTAVNDWVYMDETSREGGEKNTVFENTKQHPVTFYGATKGAAELFLSAIAFKYKIRANIVRPGYTFGNPVIVGSVTQSDTRFKDIVLKACKNEKIDVIKNDGTQFIWAGHLAEIYAAILHSEVNNKMYFGLGSKFITWETVALEAIKMTNSKSQVNVIDLGWPDKPALFDVEGIRRDFGMKFDAWDKIKEHIEFYMDQIQYI